MTKSKIPPKAGKLLILVVLLLVALPIIVSLPNYAFGQVDTAWVRRYNKSNIQGPTICSQFGKQCSSITFYESTDGVASFIIPIGDPRLSTNVNEGPPNFQYDFRGTPDEYYDVYISDAQGNLDYQNGKFVTIGCYFNAETPGYGVGNNIVAVSLDFTDGSHRWATCVSDFALGTNLLDEQIFNYGYVRNALGRNDSICTYMGDHQSSMTLGFMDASHVKLTSVELKKGGVGDWVSYAPADLESVDVGDYIRFRGTATDSNGFGVTEMPIWSYNSFQFNPDSSRPGIYITLADSMGNFIYPPVDSLPEGLHCTQEYFWPFWFSTDDSTAIGFLLTVGNGCSSCSRDSMLAYLNRDTLATFDIIGTPTDQNHPLNVIIVNYPANDSDLSAVENLPFIKSFFFKYFGPTTYGFLANPDSSGWLNIGYGLFSTLYDSLMVNFPEFFKTAKDSTKVLFFKDSTGVWRDVAAYNIDQLRFLGYNPLKTKWRVVTEFLNFTWDRYINRRKPEAALCASGGILGSLPSCVQLLVGIWSDELAKPIIQDIFCSSSQSAPVCRSTTGKIVDGVISLVTLPASVAGTAAKEAPAILGLLIKLYRLESAAGFDFGHTTREFIKGYQNLIKSYRNKGIKTLLNPSGVKFNSADSIDFDLIFTKWQGVDLSISSAWDDPQNPSILTLALQPDKILFQLGDTLEAVPKLFILNEDDTLIIDAVQKVNDSTFTAQININHLPNYIPGQKYSASIITNGYDLFSNFGQQQDPTIIGTITIEGDSLVTITGSGLLIPYGAVQDTILVTIIPGIMPELRSGTKVNMNSFPDFDSCRFLGDLTQVTPNNYQLSKPGQLILDFDTVEYKNLIDSTIAVFNYDSLTSSWRLIGGKIDTARGLISIPINRFGLFGVKVVPKSYFVAGDANGDGVIDISDVVYLINYLFIHGPAPVPLEAGDATCDGVVDVSDVVYLLNYLFARGPAPGC
jgi:hypothetical protein